MNTQEQEVLTTKTNAVPAHTDPAHADSPTKNPGGMRTAFRHHQARLCQFGFSCRTKSFGLESGPAFYAGVGGPTGSDRTGHVRLFMTSAEHRDLIEFAESR